MAELNVERDFGASAGDVWEKLGDFAELGWMPGVGSVEVEGEGIGAVRSIAMGPAKIVERLEAHDNAARSLSYSITEGPVPDAIIRTQARCSRRNRYIKLQARRTPLRIRVVTM